MRNEVRVCPRCGKKYTDYPALSRVDNKTYICPQCGVREALEDFARFESRRKSEVING